MQVKFLKDTRGAHTNGAWYAAGDVADFDEEMAKVLVDGELAEAVAKKAKPKAKPKDEA